MIKRILVVLDPDEDTVVATGYAADLARRFDAAVTGLAVIDTKHIAVEVGPGGAIGALHYAEVSRKHMTDQARETARVLTEAFASRLADAGVHHDERVEEGIPVRHVCEDLKYHDLLVIGSRSHFIYNRPEEETNTLAKIVKYGVSPTLVVGDSFRETHQVLVAYDGSDASARTVQRFAQLHPFGVSVKVELVNVRSTDSASDRHASELLLRLGGAFLRAHGFEQVIEVSMDGGGPDTRLIEHAEHIDADLIVAGAHSVSAMRRIAFGSTTYALLQHSTIPLFLYH